MENKIFKGDCFDILKNLPDNSINAILTDPPYLYLDHKLDAVYDEETLINQSYRLLKNNSLLGFFGRGESFYKLNYLAGKYKFKFKEEVIWDKLRISSPILRIGRCHENFAVYAKGKASINKVRIDKFKRDEILDSERIFDDIKRILDRIKKINTIEELNNFKTNNYGEKIATSKHSITVKGNLGQTDRGANAYRALTEGALMPTVLRVKTDHYNYQHPTQKPLELIKNLLLLISNENDLILDPFGGSGTLAIACLETNRKYICCEKDDEYFEIMKNRISQWHNDKLNATGNYDLPPDIPRIAKEKTGQLNLF